MAGQALIGQFEERQAMIGQFEKGSSYFPSKGLKGILAHSLGQLFEPLALIFLLVYFLVGCSNKFYLMSLGHGSELFS